MTSKALRIVACASSATVLLGGALASEAAAKTTTLQFFQKGGRAQFYNAAWKPVKIDPPATLPTKGDSFVETDTDFAGTAAHHARKATATDDLICTFTAPPVAVCDAQFAIGSSMLVLSHFTLNAAANKAVLKITTGAGVFSGAHGTLTEVAVGNNAELNFTGV